MYMDWLKAYKTPRGAEQINNGQNLAAEQKRDAAEWLSENLTCKEAHTLANFVARSKGINVPYPGYEKPSSR